MLIERFFDKNGIEYEEIPQNYFLNLWARELKTAEYLRWLIDFEDGLLKYVGGLFLIMASLVLAVDLIKNPSPLLLLSLLLAPFICITIIILLIFIAISFLEWRRKVGAKYENRHYFRVDKDNAKRIDELTVNEFWHYDKYSAMLPKYANDESYILIVLEGASAGSSSFLLFPERAMEKLERSTRISSKKYWFKVPKKNKSEIIQEQQEKIELLEEKLKNVRG